MQIAKQQAATQKQVRASLCGFGSLKIEPLGQTLFHIPLFASFWSVLREASVVPGLLSRGEKEVLGASVSRGNMCRFCGFWHAQSASGAGMGGMAGAWRAKNLKGVRALSQRFKATALWLRDATNPAFFSDAVRPSERPSERDGSL